MSRLDLATAQRMLAIALEHGRSLDLAPLAIAVLDPGGHLIAFAREDDAGILRPQIATGKAWGALGMGVGTRALAGKGSDFLAALGAMSGGRVVPSPGGVLVRDADGAVLGAVGVTGDTGTNDEACAVAGIGGVGLVPDVG